MQRPLLAYRGRRVAAAVSGGADSLALLLALHGLGVEVIAAHLDHALRPESEQDAEFVREVAGRLGVPFALERVDVRKVAQARGWNLEDAARRLRYSFLTRAAKAAGAEVILTAHTRRDVAETVLWQLLRGEAVLGGIPAVRGRVERPWLAVGRAEIETYLNGLGQGWREDASNADTRFTRNWLRAEVLPLLASRLAGTDPSNTTGLERALARLARFQAQDDAALGAQALSITAHAPLAGLPLAVLRRWVRAALAGQPLHAGQIEALALALHAGGTHHLTLPGGRPVTVSRGRLALTPLETPRPDFTPPAGWTLRHRLAGDRIRLPGGTRKLSDVLTDLPVPREDRGGLWLLADAQGRVQWVGLDPSLWALGAREALGLAPEGAGGETDQSAMRAALELAQQAARQGEVPVGAVVVRGGQIIAGAFNRSRAAGDPTRHAELDALRDAAAVVGGSGSLQDCTLVVTLEPCPMCLGAALEARVGRIVYGAANLRAGALGGVSDLLSHHWGHRPAVTPGVLAPESARLLRRSFRSFRQDAQIKDAHSKDAQVHSPSAPGTAPDE